MGREAQCHARLGRESGTGRALLEHDAVIFRGDFRARVPLAELTTVAAKAGTLRLTWPGGTLALALGEQAERWAQILRHPKSVVDKLGVRAGQKVAVLGVKDQELLADLAARLGAEPASRTSSGCDPVLLGVETPAALSKLAALREAVRPAGGIWANLPARPQGGRRGRDPGRGQGRGAHRRQDRAHLGHARFRAPGDPERSALTPARGAGAGVSQPFVQSACRPPLAGRWNPIHLWTARA